MGMMRLERDTVTADYTLGTLTYDGAYIGETCEDADRHLENGGEKIYGQSAIPRGTYRVILSYSPRFRKVLPELIRVPGFSGIRMHGGNTADDTLGCILLGLRRDDHGIGNCAPAMRRLTELLMESARIGDPCWIEVN